MYGWFLAGGLKRTSRAKGYRVHKWVGLLRVLPMDASQRDTWSMSVDRPCVFAGHAARMRGNFTAWRDRGNGMDWP
jgi:hypothetical protein